VALSAAAIFSASLAIAPSARAGGGICGTLADELTAERAGLELEWMVSLPIDHTQGGIEHVVIDDDLVIVQTGDGGVHAIHTGAVTPDGRCNPQVIWSTHLGSPGQPIVAASAGPELVMVPRGNELYALERSTGQIRWQQHLQQSPIAGGAAVGEWVYQPQGSATVLRLPVNPWRDTGIGSTTVEARAGGAGARASRATAAAAMAARTGKGKPTATLTSAEKRARMDATESLKPLPLNGGGSIERDMLPFGSGVLWSTRDGTIISLQQGDRDWQREEFLLDSPQAGPLATRGAAIFATTTARDLAKLSVTLCQFPEVLKFTSTKQYMLRRPGKPLELLNHNHLLDSFPGCDGLKTGWTVAAHASIVTTAKDNDVRVIAIVLGCQSPAGAKTEQRLRDSLAADLMTQGLAKLKKLEAEKASRLARTPALAPAPKASVKAKKEEGFWDWLVDLFSF